MTSPHPVEYILPEGSFGSVRDVPPSLFAGHQKPQGVDHARNTAQERKKDIDPEVDSYTHLEKRRDRRQENGKNDLHNVHSVVLSIQQCEMFVSHTIMHRPCDAHKQVDA